MALARYNVSVDVMIFPGTTMGTLPIKISSYKDLGNEIYLESCYTLTGNACCDKEVIYNEAFCMIMISPFFSSSHTTVTKFTD